MIRFFRFSLPSNADAAEKPYTFKEVDDKGAVVMEWKVDGVAKTRVLSP